MKSFELVGNKKAKILAYILENTREDNLFVGTQRTIAERTGIALKTVSTTMKMLLNAEIIKRQQHGVYLVNREVI